MNVLRVNWIESPAVIRATKLRGATCDTLCTFTLSYFSKIKNENNKKTQVYQEKMDEMRRNHEEERDDGKCKKARNRVILLSRIRPKDRASLYPLL